MLITKQNIENYLTRLEIDGRSQNTTRNYRFHLESFLKYTQDNPLTPNNCKELLEKYKLHLKQDKNYSNSSLKTATVIIKIFLLDQGLDCKGVRVPKTNKKLPKYLSTDDIKRLLDAPCDIYGTRDKAVLSLLYSSGLRVSELSGLNKDDVDFDEGMIKVNDGKGGRDRITYTNPKTLQLIKDMIYKRTRKGREDKSPALFISRTGGRLSTRSVQRIVKKASETAGLHDKNITPHILRHSFAVHLLQRGLNLKEVQQLLGHESLSTTAIYTELSDQDLKKRYQDIQLL